VIIVVSLCLRGPTNFTGFFCKHTIPNGVIESSPRPIFLGMAKPSSTLALSASFFHLCRLSLLAVIFMIIFTVFCVVQFCISLRAFFTLAKMSVSHFWVVVELG